MKRHFLPLLLTAFLVLFLHAAHALQTADTVVLQNQTKSSLAFYYIDPFRTLVDINVPPDGAGKISLTSPITVFSAIGPNRFAWYVKPGETLNVSEDASGAYVLTATDTGRTKELNFFKAMMIRFDRIRTSKDANERMIRMAQLKKDSARYAKYLHDTYREKLQYLHTYAQENKISDSFHQYAKRTLFYQMMSDRLEVVRPQKESLPALAAFPEVMNCDDCLNVRTYMDLLSNYSYRMYAACGSNAYDSIASRFKGQTKDFLLMQLMVTYLKFKPEIFETHYTAFMSGAITPIYQTYISDLKLVASLSRDFTNGGLLLSPEGDTLRFETLLGQLKDQHVYLDCWASWCVPCIDALPGTMAFEDANPAVAVVYLSLDKDPTAWKQFLRRSDLGKRRNYLVVGDFKSALAKKFGIKAIPHYVLISRDRKTVMANAPGVKEGKLLELLK